jgi:heptosyltransferase-2
MNSAKENEPKRILCIRLSAIGDVILASFLLRLLKNRFPKVEIDFLVKEHLTTLIQWNPRVDRVISFDPRKGTRELFHLVREIRIRQYDAVIDLQRNFRSALITLLSKSRKRFRSQPFRWERFWMVHFHRNLYQEIKPVPLRYLEAVSSWDVKDDGLGLELYLDSSAEQSVGNLFKASQIRENKEIVLLAPGAGRKTKRWPAERYGEVGDYFLKQGKRVVLIGGEKDRLCSEEVTQNMQSSALDFTGQLSLMETAALIEKSILLVTNDTGVMHMAAALNRNVVSIFGPTTRHFGFAPFRCRSVIVEKEMPCRPCSYHGTEFCPKGHFRCMLDIDSGQVIRAAETLLN